MEYRIYDARSDLGYNRLFVADDANKLVTCDKCVVPVSGVYTPALLDEGMQVLIKPMYFRDCPSLPKVLPDPVVIEGVYLMPDEDFEVVLDQYRGELQDRYDRISAKRRDAEAAIKKISTKIQVSNCASRNGQIGLMRRFAEMEVSRFTQGLPKPDLEVMIRSLL